MKNSTVTPHGAKPFTLTRATLSLLASVARPCMARWRPQASAFRKGELEPKMKRQGTSLATPVMHASAARIVAGVLAALALMAPSAFAQTYSPLRATGSSVRMRMLPDNSPYESQVYINGRYVGSSKSATVGQRSDPITIAVRRSIGPAGNPTGPIRQQTPLPIL
jgi:hypothetical protein